MLQKILLNLAAIAALLGGNYAILKNKPVGTGYGPVRSYYDVIGTSSTPAVLTASYNGNSTTIRAPYLENLHLNVQFISGNTSTNNYAYILIEGSNNEGQTFFPLAVKDITADEIDLYVKDLDGNIGIPVIIPGDKVSATGTVYKGATDFDMVADMVRISAKTNVSGLTSTLYIRAVVTSP